MSFFEFSGFDYSNWSKPEHEILKDLQIRSSVYENGYHILKDHLDKEVIAKLIDVYEQNHSIAAEEGGMFVTIYSKDTAYRKKINTEIQSILGEKLDPLFQDFKSTGYNFIVKYPGKGGEMFPHQDMPFVDERKYSEVGLWIPLQRVSLYNGCLGIIPASHFTIPPVRSLHHALPFSNVYDLIRTHVAPVEMNAGDVLLYDPRILHNSFPNFSNEKRIAIATRLSPKEAEYTIAYKDPQSNSEEFEQIKVEDDFFLEFDDFVNDQVRKPQGESVGSVRIKNSLVSKDEFVKFCETLGLTEQPDSQRHQEYQTTNSITEPVPSHNSKHSQFELFMMKLKTLLST